MSLSFFISWLDTVLGVESVEPGAAGEYGRSKVGVSNVAGDASVKTLTDFEWVKIPFH